MEETKQKNPWKVIAIILIVIAIITGGYFGIQNYTYGIADNAYQLGVMQMASTQTQQGVIFYVENNTIQSMPLNELCGMAQQGA